MHVPVRFEAKLKKIHPSKFNLASMGYPFERVPSGSALPFEFQVQLKSLRKFVNDCRSSLNDIQMNFEHFEIDPGNTSILSKAAKQLGRFCLEADSWGFNSLCDVAQALQMLILENSSREWNNPLYEAFNKGLHTLSVLVEKCETDFRWNWAIDETLECLSQAGQKPGN